MNWMDQAFEEAIAAEQEDEVPIGAVIVLDGVVMGRGRNQREKLQSPLSHAEIHALLSASEQLKSWRLLGAELYVTLEPCPMCLAACQQARLARVIYGARDPKGGAISLGYAVHEDQRLNHRFEVVFQEESRCGEVLSKFFQKKRQKNSAKE